MTVLVMMSLSMILLIGNYWNLFDVVVADDDDVDFDDELANYYGGDDVMNWLNYYYLIEDCYYCD